MTIWQLFPGKLKKKVNSAVNLNGILDLISPSCRLPTILSICNSYIVNGEQRTCVLESLESC